MISWEVRCGSALFEIRSSGAPAARLCGAIECACIAASAFRPVQCQRPIGQDGQNRYLAAYVVCKLEFG